MPRLKLKPLKTIDRDMAIYMAGLFDGEGCVNICERDPHHGGIGQKTPYLRCEMSMSNTHHGVLLLIKEKVGGVIYGPVKNLPRKDGKPRKPCWRWSASQRESAHILRQILPFMVIKRNQATLALEFYDSVREYVHRPHPGNLGCAQQTPEELERRRELAKRMQALNHLSTLESST